MEEQRKNSYDPNEDIVDRMWKRSKNSINLVIVVCNILVFLAVTLTGGTESSRHMMDCGAAYAPLIESGEYYRLFTSMFLHFGIQHLINNMLLLLFLGDYLERAVGKIRYLVIYLGGGLVGNLCSYLHELSLMKTGEAPAVSAGASGAIFSAVGAMLVLLAFRKGRLEDLTFRRMAVMAVLSLLVGFQSSNVDNFAHIGGFLAGAVLMAVLYPGRNGDRAVVCGYNFLADGKSKAGSVFLMCDKKVKESRQILGGDSAASVLHTDGQKVTVETERDFDRSAGRHCFRRISDQVQKKLTKLRGIKGKARNGRFLDKFNGNLLFFEENAGIGTEILEQKIRIHVSAYRPI